MANIKEVIEMIYSLYRGKHRQPNSQCPNEESLVCFSEGKLSLAESKEIQEHLISCRRCAEAVSLFCQRFEETKAVPEFLIEKAKNLMEEKNLPNIVEVILAVKEKALQILGTTGDVILDNEIIPLPVLRSRQISEFPEEIKLIKEFNNIKITLYIQKKDKDKVKININLLNKTSLLPLENLRLVFLKASQEIESYEVILGNVVFDNIRFGRYTIQILRQDEKLGAIHLEIK
jgi:hypothetical protein